MANGLRTPSAGFSQGWGFLVLDTPADMARFRDAVRPEDNPEDWLAANMNAPLLIIPHSNKDAYLDRYALPGKGFTDRSDAWWPAPYWDIDTGFASLLILPAAVDAGLGLCFFSIPIDRFEFTGRRSESQRNSHRSERSPSDTAARPQRDLSSRRKPETETIHRGRWNQAVT